MLNSGHLLLRSEAPPPVYYCRDMELQEYLQMPKLMLSQLRMLDHLVDGKVAL